MPKVGFSAHSSPDMHPGSKRQWFVVLGFFLLEVLCHTYLRNAINHHLTSALYLFAGLAIGTIAMFSRPVVLNPGASRYQIVQFVIVFGTIGYAFYSVPSIFTKYPLDYRVADMLPVIQVMVDRFMAGEDIYARIWGIWNVRPIYLPAMWLPFVPASLLGVDIRYTTVIALFAGIAAVLLFRPKRQHDHPLLLAIWVPLGILIAYLLRYDIRLFAVTQEGVVVGFYLLLGLAILLRKPALTGILLACCVLSRYALLFWIPVLAVVSLASFSRHQLKRLIIASALTAATLVVISDVYTQVFVQSRLYTTYKGVVQDASKAEKYIAVIEESLGLAKFLPFEEVKGLFPLSLIIQGIMVLILSGVYLRYKNRFDPVLFLLGSLKCFLVIFYNFLFIPVLYLFCTSTFFSLVLVVGMLHIRERKHAGQL